MKEIIIKNEIVELNHTELYSINGGSEYSESVINFFGKCFGALKKGADNIGKVTEADPGWASINAM